MVAGLEARSLFIYSLFFFPVCSLSPMSASIDGIEVGFCPLYFDPFFLPSFHLFVLSFFSPFMVLVRADLAVAGVCSCMIKKINELVDRVRRVTKGLTDDVQGGFGSGR